MQILAFDPSPKFPAARLAAVSRSLQRANAEAPFHPACVDADHLRQEVLRQEVLREEEITEPTDASSVGEGSLSHAIVDPRGSKTGPVRVQTAGRVQTLAELKAFLQRLYPAKMAERVAADTGIAADTVRKWFFRKPQRRPDLVSRVRLAQAYGADLAAEAGLPAAAWREAFLYSQIETERAA